ncbi:MAG: peptidylprolyl isomerase [Sandaracinaceae bacterium]|nr:peptidylprolyl isomerase [Sandaracinaceae bacterium]
MSLRSCAPLALLLVSGCPSSPATDAGAGTPDAPLALDAPSAPDAPGEYVPDGFTRTPDLGDGSVHSFPAGPDMVLEAGVDYAMVLETDVGRLVIDLLEDEAPISTNSYVFLARQRFFDGTNFHRVIEGFMAQGGDPNTLGASRSRWGLGDAGYAMDIEVTSGGATFDGPGVMGMANAGPGTNSSQFFLTFASAHHLDGGGFTIVGRVTEGLDVLPSIARGEPPTTPTVVTRAYIVQR